MSPPSRSRRRTRSGRVSGIGSRPLGGKRSSALGRAPGEPGRVCEPYAVVTADGVDENELLRLAAAVERESEHPLAEAIVRAARERGLDPMGCINAIGLSTG